MDPYSRTTRNNNDTHSRPTYHAGKSLKKAHAEFKKHGPRVSSQEARQLARGAELLKRAERIRENERKRKHAAKMKQEKERREREARRRMGIASQEKIHLSPRQGRLGDFLKAEKRGGSCEEKRPPLEAQENLGCDGASGRKEPLSGGWQEETSRKKADVDDDPWELEDLDERLLLDTMENVRAAACSVKRQEEPGLPSEKNECSDKASLQNNIGAKDKRETPMQLLINANDIWDDFVVSATQVQREISSESPPETPSPQDSISPPRSPDLCTQDVAFTDDDMAELGLGSHDPPVENTPALSSVSVPCETADGRKIQVEMDRDRFLMPPPATPASKLVGQTVTRVVPRSILPSVFTTSLPLDFLEADFDLSSQDCREIDGD